MTAPDWAWAGLAAVIQAWWMVYDFVIAPRYGWPTMTGRFRHYLHETVLGPVMAAVLAGIPVAFIYHLFQQFAKQR